MSRCWRLESGTKTGIFLHRKEQCCTVRCCSALCRRTALPSSPSWTGTCHAQPNGNKYAEAISGLNGWVSGGCGVVQAVPFSGRLSRSCGPEVLGAAGWLTGVAPSPVQSSSHWCHLPSSDSNAGVRRGVTALGRCPGEYSGFQNTIVTQGYWQRCLVWRSHVGAPVLRFKTSWQPRGRQNCCRVSEPPLSPHPAAPSLLSAGASTSSVL